MAGPRRLSGELSVSGEMRGLRFGMTTTDSQHWTEAQRAEAEACREPDRSGYADHVAHLVEAAMLEAGNRVVQAHPEMFACEIT